MLISTKTITNKTLEATDGEIGRCKDFLFDDRFWTIRYMVADTRKWLPGRKVLISPISLSETDWEPDRLPVQLSKTQVKESPGIEEDLPVSKQYEIAFSQYYGWANYWHGPLTWGSAHNPADLFIEPPSQNHPNDNIDADSHHLRSAKEVIGYYIEASKESVGKITDFIIDEKSWTIRYMVVHNGSWLSGKKCLISPMWVIAVDWSSSKVEVDLSPSQIQNIPKHDESIVITREYENLLWKSCSKNGYWETEKKKIAEKLITQGEKRVNESQYLKNKGEKILSEKLPELKKIKTRITEGEKITKEAKKIIKTGENIVSETDFPERNIGVRKVVMGKQLEKVGQQKIEYYETKKEQIKEWIATGKSLIEEGRDTKKFGETLKESGRKLVTPAKQQNESKEH